MKIKQFDSYNIYELIICISVLILDLIIIISIFIIFMLYFTIETVILVNYIFMTEVLSPILKKRFIKLKNYMYYSKCNKYGYFLWLILFVLIFLFEFIGYIIYSILYVICCDILFVFSLNKIVFSLYFLHIFSLLAYLLSSSSNFNSVFCIFFLTLSNFFLSFLMGWTSLENCTWSLFSP